MHMTVVCGIFPGILSAIYFAVGAMIMLLSSGVETDLVILPVIDTTVARLKVMVINILPLVLVLWVDSRCLNLQLHLDHLLLDYHEMKAQSLALGAAMPLAGQSLDGSDQGEQRPSIPGLPPGQPPLPLGPHPSILAAGQQQQFQQMPQQQHPQFPQRPPPPNMPPLHPPAHMLPHQQGPRPPITQLPSIGGPSVPSPMNPPLPPMPHPMAMQGSQNQMMSQMPPHMIGLNQMHPGPGPPGNVLPMAGFPNGMGSIQGASGSSGMQNFPISGLYNRPQGQMTSIPGLSSYQGMGNVGLTPPLPPPPRGSAPQ